LHEKQQPGFQIDILIDLSDNSIKICEMKLYNTEFEQSKKEQMSCGKDEICLELKQKIKNTSSIRWLPLID
jgi:3-isopropylmalate dehydratase small subunit